MVLQLSTEENRYFYATKMKKIKILYTIPNFITAGSGQVLFNIVSRLDQERYSPHVGVLRKGGKIERDLERVGIPVLELPFTIPVKPYWSLVFRAYKASRIFKPYDFQFWHSFHYASDYSEPIIARLAGVKNWVYTKKNMDWNSRSWLLRSLLATRIACDNSDMPDLFFNQYGLKKKTAVIRHGIPLDDFSPNVIVSDNYRVSFGIPENNILVGCVAQLSPRKDQATLIEAISKLKSVHIFLAGPETVSGYKKQLEDQASSMDLMNRVHFLGKVDDIPSFLSQMDMTVLPSREEAFGVVLIESMACGKPAITTDISGPRDIVDDGVSGFVVPPGDPLKLSKAIQTLAEDSALRDRMGKAARTLVEEKFSIEREVSDYEEFYENLPG